MNICPLCDGPCEEQNCKIVCTNCRVIVANCNEF